MPPSDNHLCSFSHMSSNSWPNDSIIFFILIYNMIPLFWQTRVNFSNILISNNREVTAHK